MLLALGVSRAADPVRIAVYTSNPQQLPEALHEFERANGAGLIDLVVIDAETPPEKVASARVIYAYLMNAALYAQFAGAAHKAASAGAAILAQPPDIAEHRWQVKPDAKASAEVYEYWNNGGVDNLSAFLAYCYRLGGGERNIALPAPQQRAVKGIYHPRAQKPFDSLSDYLAWYSARKLVPENAPLAGILFYQTNYKVHDLAHIDALVAALERRGIGAVPVFGWPVPALAAYLGEPGRTPLRLLYSFNLGFAQSSDGETLDQYGLHVIDLMTRRPAKLLKLSAGSLAAGAPADVCLFDPEEKWTYQPRLGFSKSNNSPWEGQTLTGKVKLTLVDGRIVFDGKKIV